MNIIHRITYDKTEVDKEFIQFLEEKKAKFDKTSNDIGIVYICEEDEWKDDLYDYMQKNKAISLIEAKYSKQEFEQAKWLSVRSKYRFEYPQPDDYFAYRSSTYDDKNYCVYCGSGLTQKDSFRVNHSPKWTKRHFLMLNWVHDELFISSLAKDCIENNRITGLKILDVVDHKKNVRFEDFYQIYVERKLEPGLINLTQSVKDVRNCDVCGSTKYIYTGRGLTFKKEAFDNVDCDIIKSFESFGEGLICANKIFISAKLFHIIEENGLGKDLTYQPIVLA